jgi:cell division protein FtsA
MRRNKYFSAIDLGSTKIRVMIAETFEEEDDKVRVIGVGEAPSFGMRKGSIADGESLSKSLMTAVGQAETMAGVQIREATISLGGLNIRTQRGKGVIAVGKVDGEVVQDDVERAISAVEKTDIPLNYEIIHIIPRSYRLDDQTDIVDPIGMQGVRLEVDAVVIIAFSPQIKQIRSLLLTCGIEARQFVFSPLAAAEAVLDRQQKELGVAVVDIGGMTTGLTVYEEGELLHCTSFAIGSSHITNDIAIGLRTSIDLAERVKVEYGTANLDTIDKDEDIRLSSLDPSEEGDVSRYHVGEIIEARLEEILEKVSDILRSLEKEHPLPSGLILVGGGSNMPEIIEMTKNFLALPVSLGYPKSLSGIVDKVDDPGYAVVTGLIHWQIHNDFEKNGGGGNPLLPIFHRAKEWFKIFMP